MPGRVPDLASTDDALGVLKNADAEMISSKGTSSAMTLLDVG